MLKFLKVRDVKSPQRTKGNAGIDIFVPNYSPDFVKDLMEKNPFLLPQVTSELRESLRHKAYSSEALSRAEASLLQGSSNLKFDENGMALIPILPHGDILIPSGLKAHFDENIALVAFNKSGQATKKRLDIGACVIDSSYRGEIHIHVTNTSDKLVYITFGEKLIQLLPLHINTEELAVIEDMDEEEFYGKDLVTDRGTGGFGSTSIK